MITKWLSREKLRPREWLHVCKGDTISVLFNGKEVTSARAERDMTIDEVGVCEIEVDGHKGIAGVAFEHQV